MTPPQPAVTGLQTPSLTAWMVLKLVRRRVEDEAAVLGRHDAGGAARERREQWLEARAGGK